MFLNRYTTRIRLSAPKLTRSTYSAVSDSRKEYFFASSDRYLYNEKEQLASRYVKFDVEALQETARLACKADKCVSFEKMGEGSYNKIFVLRFKDGQEVIARIPSTIAGPPFWTTASEAATMAFAREILGIPAPRVLAYSADRRNPVGTEYIIAEKVQGTTFERCWPAANNIAPLLKQFIEVEKALESMPFSQLGSLYFQNDVSLALKKAPLFRPGAIELKGRLKEAAARFRVGPIADRQWYCGGRRHMRFDRGPWSTAAAYYAAAIRNEMAWVRSPEAAKAQFRKPPFHAPEVHLRLLELGLRVVNSLLPSDPSLQSPTLWHPDLSESNLMVSDVHKPKLLGLIDWQHAIIGPYFSQATVPDAFAYSCVYEGSDERFVPALMSPRLPAWPDSYSFRPEEEASTYAQHRIIHRHKAYLEAAKASSKRRAEALKLEFLSERASFPLLALRSWSDGIAPLLRILLPLERVWDSVDPTRPCPIDFTAAERELYMAELERADRYDRAVEEVMDAVGAQVDGEVSAERYDAAKTECRRLEQDWDERAKGGPFPFKDGGHSFFLS